MARVHDEGAPDAAGDGIGSSMSTLRGGRVRSRDGTLLAYLSLGEGPLVVCLHGGFNTGLDWLPVARLLADRYRFVLVDRRGHGASDSGVDGHTLDLETEDLAAILAATGPAELLLAHSFGSLVALHAAAGPLAGEIGSLMLYEPPLLERAGDAAMLAKVGEHIEAGRYEEAMADTLLGVLEVSERDLAAMRASDRFWAGMVALAPSLPAQSRIMAEAAGSPERFGDIGQPTLLLIGEYSDPATFGSSVARLAAAMPRARAVTLAGQGHSAMARGPETLAAELAKFLPGR